MSNPLIINFKAHPSVVDINKVDIVSHICLNSFITISKDSLNSDAIDHVKYGLTNIYSQVLTNEYKRRSNEVLDYLKRLHPLVGAKVGEILSEPLFEFEVKEVNGLLYL